MIDRGGQEGSGQGGWSSMIVDGGKGDSGGRSWHSGVLTWYHSVRQNQQREPKPICGALETQE